MVCGSLPRCDSEPFAHEPGLWWDGGRGVRKCPGIPMLSFRGLLARPVHCWGTRREIFISSRLVRASKVRGWAPRPVACRCRSHKARSLAVRRLRLRLGPVGVVLDVGGLVIPSHISSQVQVRNLELPERFRNPLQTVIGKTPCHLIIGFGPRSSARAWAISGLFVGSPKIILPWMKSEVFDLFLGIFCQTRNA